MRTLHLTVAAAALTAMAMSGHATPDAAQTARTSAKANDEHAGDGIMSISTGHDQGSGSGHASIADDTGTDSGASHRAQHGDSLAAVTTLADATFSHSS